MSSWIRPHEMHREIRFVERSTFKDENNYLRYFNNNLLLMRNDGSSKNIKPFQPLLYQNVQNLFFNGKVLPV